MAATIQSTARQRPSRRGITGGVLIGTLGLGAVLVGAGLWAWSGLQGTTAPGDWITQPATRGTFVHDITERGELESSNNISVRCEVQSRGTGTNGVKIIEIVAEGAVVKKDDFLVKFDDSALVTERTTQQINVSSAEAAAAQSANDLDSAVYSRKEYEFGEFETEREVLNGEILVADEMRARAEDTLRFRQKQIRSGYSTRSEVRSSEFDLKKFTSELKTAQTKLNALEQWTKLKNIKDLDAKIKTCEAKLKSDEAKLALERQKLSVLDDQIAKCVVKAPAAGQVIYDHEQDHWRGAEYQIKQGTVIHEQRVVIRLPDPARMQVVAKVAESRIDRIKPGMLATVEIEGLPGAALTGKVTKVNEYPAPENWFNSSVKEYATKVEIDNPPSGLRPGMTAKVSIRVETLAEAVQVPVQAVVERGGKHYCLVARGAEIEPREVLAGSTNEKFMVVRDGVAEGERVLMNPRTRLSALKLPDEPTPAAAKVAQEKAKPAGSEPTRAPVAVGGPGL